MSGGRSKTDRIYQMFENHREWRVIWLNRDHPKNVFPSYMWKKQFKLDSKGDSLEEQMCDPEHWNDYDGFSIQSEDSYPPPVRHSTRHPTK
jgi:hypothetical protein